MNNSWAKWIEKNELFESIPQCIKRGPYISYKNYPDAVDKILKIFSNYIEGDVAKIAKKTGFKERTLYKWLANYRLNPEYNPLSKQIRNKARIFTEDEEDAIAEFILTEKIQKHCFFNDSECIEILVDAYLTMHSNDENINFLISFSRGFIYYFKKRHGFVSRICHLKRRPSTTSVYINYFIDDMKNLFQTVSFTQIINIDETGIFLNSKNIKIWHSKGNDDVSLPVGFSEKKRITAVCAIGADGAKFPMQFIAKGETDAVINTQLGDVHPHLASYSTKGWTNDETFYSYLNFIKSQFNQDQEIHIILDIFSAHRSENTKKIAEELGITLHYIPAGFTDLYQPLDTTIFAIIKAFISHMLRSSLKEGKNLTTIDACRFMIAAWEKLKPDIIQESFDRLHLEEVWEGCNQYDLPIMHTCLYNRSTKSKKKLMILEVIEKDSIKDDNGISLLRYIIDSFGQKDVLEIKTIGHYVKQNASFVDLEGFEQNCSSSISKLLCYKILKQVNFDLLKKNF